MDQLIELLQKIQELAGVGVDALKGASGDKNKPEGGPPDRGAPPERGGPPQGGPPMRGGPPQGGPPQGAPPQGGGGRPPFQRR